MGFMTNLKAEKAYRAHAKGDLTTAKAGYEAMYAEGMNNPKHLIGYAILLMREDNYEKAVEVLRKAEKAPGVMPEHKQEIITHYAICIFKQGRVERAVELVQGQFEHAKNAKNYGTLGYMLIELGDAERALAFNKEAVEYDDEDAVFLDNLAQTYYRLLNDKQSAKEYFLRALAARPTSIDSNYFLAKYDEEEGKTAEAIEKLELIAGGRFSPLNYVTKAQVEAELERLKSIHQ